MSRIHDALKKSAEERVWQPPASSAQTFVEVTEGNIRSAPAGNGLDTAPKNGSAKADKQTFLRFEQLLNRCAHPKWTLDPRMSVFGGTDSKKIGAEPFRTLRSRLSQIADTRLLKRVVITRDRKSTRLNSSHGYISYAVFCLKKKIIKQEATCPPSSVWC